MPDWWRYLVALVAAFLGTLLGVMSGDWVAIGAGWSMLGMWLVSQQMRHAETGETS